jgi:hypothetical protein
LSADLAATSVVDAYDAMIQSDDTSAFTTKITRSMCVAIVVDGTTCIQLVHTSGTDDVHYFTCLE